MPQGLNGVRKSAQLRAGSRKDVAQGLKPVAFYRLYRHD